MEFHIRFIGGLFILLAFCHVFIPSFFGWKKELGSLSLINRQMIYAHLFFVGLGLFLLGLLCLTSSHVILATSLGRRLSLGLGIFWAVRLYFQLFVYSPRLWRGKAFEKRVHLLFSVFWAYAATVFIWGFFGLQRY